MNERLNAAAETTSISAEEDLEFEDDVFEEFGRGPMNLTVFVEPL